MFRKFDNSIFKLTENKGEEKNMLFGPGVLIAGGATILLACLDKTLEGYGFQFIGKVLRFAIPLAAMATGVYFLETNAILEWLR